MKSARVRELFFDRLADDFLTSGVGVVFLEREAGFFLGAGSEIGLEGEEAGVTSLEIGVKETEETVTPRICIECIIRERYCRGMRIVSGVESLAPTSTP